MPNWPSIHGRCEGMAFHAADGGRLAVRHWPLENWPICTQKTELSK